MKKSFAVFLFFITPLSAYAEDIQVIIDHHAFRPSTLTVKADTKVTWVNHDDDPHVVMDSSTRFFRSGNLYKNDTYSYVFSKPGTYGYLCTMHPAVMQGKIIVTP